MSQEALEVPLSLPIGMELYDHQEAGVRWLMSITRGLLADDQGLGKTIQAIVAGKHVGDRVLVVCPASVVGNWCKEIETWSGRKGWKLTSYDRPGASGWYVVSPDTAKRDGPLKRSLLASPWDVVIIDEAHQVKNPRTARWKALSKLKAERLWLMTGTPIMSRPMDFFGLLKICDHPLGRNKHQFGVRFCGATRNRWSGGWDYLGASNLDELAQELDSWMIRRTKDEVLDLPPKNRIERWVSVPSPEAVTDKTSLMAARSALALRKVAATTEIALECLQSGPVVVFSEYLGPISELSEKLTGAGYRVDTITGSTSQSQRLKTVERFQSGELDVLVGQTLAAGVGITLTASSYVVFNDLSLVPAYHAQAEDRVYRIGTEKPVFAYYTLADSKLDATLWGMLKSKIETINRFEEGLSEAVISTSDLISRLR
jgi:SWI/SNF-related matrix-associated actin-dependent regulator 1 of chromatin subfamily A